MSISLSKTNEAEDKNGSRVSGESGSVDGFPMALLLSLLSSSAKPNMDKASSGRSGSFAAKMGVDGGTSGLLLLLFNDDDSDDGSCFTTLEFIIATADELFTVEDVGELMGIPFDKHFLSNS
jgi:hypothetical protein